MCKTSIVVGTLVMEETRLGKPPSHPGLFHDSISKLEENM